MADGGAGGAALALLADLPASRMGQLPYLLPWQGMQAMNPTPSAPDKSILPFSIYAFFIHFCPI